MGEPERKREDVVAELAAKAAVAAGKDAAERAARGLLDGDAKDETSRRTRKWKILAGVVLALCLVLGLIGLVLNYWAYFLVAGLLGLAGLYGYWRLRSKLAARREDAKLEAPAEPAALETGAKASKQALRVEEVDDAARDASAAAEREARRAEAERDAKARAEAQAVREQEVEDELAAMKARLGK